MPSHQPPPKKKDCTIDMEKIRIWRCGTSAPTVYIHSVAGDGHKVMDACRRIGCPEFNLVSIYGFDFDADMTPWPAPGVRKGQGAFAGNALTRLKDLTERIIPETEASLPAPSLYNAIAGYSLAGLFALWSAWNTGRFSRIACCSGSLWYPGFKDYAAQHQMIRLPEFIYMSLGDNESNTRNQTMNKVGECTETTLALLDRLGIPHKFEMNPGNHFSDPDGRLAKGIRSMLMSTGE